MLLTKTVIMKWNSRNKKHYEAKGYIYTKMEDEFEVDVNDLLEGSHIKVNIKCDCKDCQNPYLKPMTWKNYLRYKHGNKYYCKNCAMKLYGGKNLSIALLEKNGVSFGYWLMKNLSLKQAVEIIARWDGELNGCDIREICYSSTGFDKKGYWFKCPRGLHPSELKNISSFVGGQEGFMRCNMCNSLGFLYPKVKLIWSDKNNKSPYEYSFSSNQYAWFKCLDGKHDDAYRRIQDVVKCEFRCAECVNDNNFSILQQKVNNYLNSFDYIILHENNCTIVPKNPKTNYSLPFDNEINELKLIIEVHGIQHYSITNFHNLSANKFNTTPEYELHRIQLHDRYKKFIAYKQGYNYIEIPYLTDDKNETWKQLINNKIKEIKIYG
ncbi:hypothetical protein [Clostridium sp.]|uniref:hypothetical protein n=1 Tax=Clostridium sp. TaxID=1506 RepID=UPI0026329E7E|nr:hypothetical protein [Clostridium sp.]